MLQYVSGHQCPKKATLVRSGLAGQTPDRGRSQGRCRNHAHQLGRGHDHSVRGNHDPDRGDHAQDREQGNPDQSRDTPLDPDPQGHGRGQAHTEGQCPGQGHVTTGVDALAVQSLYFRIHLKLTQ